MATQTQISALKSSAREIYVDTLRNVGYIDGHKVIPSRKDKAADPRRQRKQKDWLKDYR